jgi:hypothetical protein
MKFAALPRRTKKRRRRAAAGSTRSAHDIPEKGREAMRGLFLTVTAFMVLGAAAGCRLVGGGCPCAGGADAAPGSDHAVPRVRAWQPAFYTPPPAPAEPLVADEQPPAQRLPSPRSVAQETPAPDEILPAE